MVRTYQVEYLIHPDDTGKDNTSVEDLEERANSDAVQSAVVAGQASYATSAQTNNPNVNKIATDDSYSVPAMRAASSAKSAAAHFEHSSRV